MSVSLDGISKTFGPSERARPALDDISLDVRSGELVVVVGPSGSGKSTMLRCVAGLERPDSGTVRVKGVDVTDLNPAARDVAMVFQDHALYPHLDVATNISFPLQARKLERSTIAERVARAASMLDIEDLMTRRPGELSGGERRRVSLAKAVVREPAAFLMDEPLSNLDAGLRLRLLDEIRTLQRSTGTTTIYVTHDQTEAMMLGGRVAVLREGHIEQVGHPLALYDEPANTFVARFIGRLPMNLVPSSVLGIDRGPKAGVRPEHLRTVPHRTGRVDGAVARVDHLGSEALFEVTSGDLTLLVASERTAAPAVGDQVALDFDDDRVHLFDGDGIRIP